VQVNEKQIRTDEGDPSFKPQLRPRPRKAPTGNVGSRRTNPLVNPMPKKTKKQAAPAVRGRSTAPPMPSPPAAPKPSDAVAEFCDECDLQADLPAYFQQEYQQNTCQSHVGTRSFDVSSPYTSPAKVSTTDPPRFVEIQPSTGDTAYYDYMQRVAEVLQLENLVTAIPPRVNVLSSSLARQTAQWLQSPNVATHLGVGHNFERGTISALVISGRGELHTSQIRVSLSSTAYQYAMIEFAEVFQMMFPSGVMASHKICCIPSEKHDLLVIFPLEKFLLPMVGAMHDKVPLKMHRHHQTDDEAIGMMSIETETALKYGIRFYVKAFKYLFGVHLANATVSSTLAARIAHFAGLRNGTTTNTCMKCSTAKIDSKRINVSNSIST